MSENILLNEHNKEEFPPAHTAEHLLNQLMMRMFGCERSDNAHIERKKSKISYILDHKPDRKEEREIERQMNELISEDLPVSFEYVTRAELDGIIMAAEPDTPEADLGEGGSGADVDMQHLDPLFEDAARLIVINQSGSTSLIQRKFAIGYNRAGRLMDQLEKAGVVGAAMGSKPREVMIQDEMSLNNLLNSLK